MPELPEVQALAERLHDRLAGARFAAVEPLAFSALKTVVPSPAELLGHAVETVGRRGKFLTFQAEGPCLLVHLSQGGRIDLIPAATGGRPKGDEKWKFALCRYDYSVDFEGPELSTCAPLKTNPFPNFHFFEDYAPLKFVGP